MIYFDFLYYLIYRFYAGYKNEKSPDSTASAIVGGFQTINILSVWMIIQGMIIPRSKFDKTIAIIVFLLFQVLNYIRYMRLSNYSTSVIQEKWEKRTPSSQKDIRVGLSLYGFMSIAIFFGLAIYFGSRR